MVGLAKQSICLFSNYILNLHVVKNLTESLERERACSRAVCGRQCRWCECGKTREGGVVGGTYGSRITLREVPRDRLEGSGVSTDTGVA